MRNNFNDVTLFLNNIDNDPLACMNFLEHPELLVRNIANIHLHLRQSGEALTKMDIIFAMMRSTVMQYNYPKDVNELEAKVRELYMFINDRYDKYIWRLHDVHFHTNFGFYVNCTFTTASEISEVIMKMMGEYFHA